MQTGPQRPGLIHRQVLEPNAHGDATPIHQRHDSIGTQYNVNLRLRASSHPSFEDWLVREFVWCLHAFQYPRLSDFCAINVAKLPTANRRRLYVVERPLPAQSRDFRYYLLRQSLFRWMLLS